MWSHGVSLTADVSIEMNKECSINTRLTQVNARVSALMEIYATNQRYDFHRNYSKPISL